MSMMIAEDVAMMTTDDGRPSDECNETADTVDSNESSRHQKDLVTIYEEEPHSRPLEMNLQMYGKWYKQYDELEYDELSMHLISISVKVT